MENNQVSIGFVIGLDYENPYLHRSTNSSASSSIESNRNRGRCSGTGAACMLI